MEKFNFITNKPKPGRTMMMMMMITASTPFLGQTHPPIQRKPGAISARIKAAGE
jgi:hypothetical protein